MMRKHRPRIDYNLKATVIKSIPWFQEQVLIWFKIYGRSFPWREPNRNAYEILIAEILLQRTLADRCKIIYPQFLKQYPNWSCLADTTLDDLQVLIKPLGLWRQKAQSLISLAKYVMKQNGSFPESRQELEELPAIGQYIASAMLLSNGQPEPLLDVNMARVLERFFGPRKLADIRDDPYLQTLARKVVTVENSLIINWAILDFGALICKARQPDCEICPLNSRCIYFSNLE